MPDKVLTAMQKGALPAELAGVLGVRKEDVLNWLKDIRKTDFRDAFKLGLAASESYWARMAHEALTSGLSKSFREKLYIYILESQFGWGKTTKEMDKIEHTDVLSDEELDAKLDELIGKHGTNVKSIASAMGQKKRKA